ncbi:glycosyltransferase family 2 protein [Candidatus Roizmanbacteria bacterium]|nr:glycosyltransferase family 2 protein [Candidatus Roizmanbacteria bacterium]
MPSYNGKQYISQAIRSLLDQTYQNYELIISDDNSTDDTSKICRLWAKKDKRLRFFTQKKRLGVAQNFNFVLKKARGKYFVWAGQDDLWDKHFIATLLQLLKDYPNATTAVSNYENLFEGKTYIVKKHDFDNVSLASFRAILHFLKTNNLSYFYGLHRTSVLKKIGGYHQDSRPFFHSSDHLTILKILFQGNVVFSKKVLFFKRDTGTYTKRFSYLEELLFTQKVRRSILRYLSFPLSFLYDLFYSLSYTARSRFTLVEKLILICSLLIFFLKRNLDFMMSILLGIWHVLKGVFRYSYHVQ